MFDINCVKQHNIKGAIFDMDGTLTNSMWAWEKVYVRLFEHIGVPFDSNFMMEVNHLPMRKRADVIVERYNLSVTSQQLFDTWKGWIDEYYANVFVPKDFVVDIIKQLYQSGVKMGVATASETSSCKLFLNANGLDKYFDSITGLNEVDRPKSFPDVYLSASAKLGVKPEQCLVFEDALTPILGAKSGGFVTVAVADVSSKTDEQIIISTADMYVGFNND